MIFNHFVIVKCYSLYQQWTDFMQKMFGNVLLYIFVCANYSSLL